MTTLEIWLLAISLAMDCFTVSITSGIIMRRICWRTFFIMAFFFGLFQAVMPLIGWFAASRFSHLIEDYDHWIAFGLLAFLGGRMIKESFSNEDKRCFDPTKLKVVVTLAIATSIDALAIGISFAFVGINSFTSILSPIALPRSNQYSVWFRNRQLLLLHPTVLQIQYLWIEQYHLRLPYGQ